MPVAFQITSSGFHHACHGQKQCISFAFYLVHFSCNQYSQSCCNVIL